MVSPNGYSCQGHLRMVPACHQRRTDARIAWHLCDMYCHCGEGFMSLWTLFWLNLRTRRLERRIKAETLYVELDKVNR